jgi:hypothetical protein
VVADCPSYGNVQTGRGDSAGRGRPVAQVGADARHPGSGVDTTEIPSEPRRRTSRLGPRTGASRTGGEIQGHYRTIKTRTFPAFGTATRPRAELRTLATRISMNRSAYSLTVHSAYRRSPPPLHCFGRKSDGTAERCESTVWSAQVAAALRGDLNVTVLHDADPISDLGTPWLCSSPWYRQTAEDGSELSAGFG